MLSFPPKVQIMSWQLQPGVCSGQIQFSAGESKSEIWTHSGRTQQREYYAFSLLIPRRRAEPRGSCLPTCLLSTCRLPHFLNFQVNWNSNFFIYTNSIVRLRARYSSALSLSLPCAAAAALRREMEGLLRQTYSRKAQNTFYYVLIVFGGATPFKSWPEREAQQ